MWFPSSAHSQASASPDLGIESDHGRFSSLDTQTTKSTAISISEFILLTFKKSLVQSFFFSHHSFGSENYIFVHVILGELFFCRENNTLQNNG